MRNLAQPSGTRPKVPMVHWLDSVDCDEFWIMNQPFQEEAALVPEAHVSSLLSKASLKELSATEDYVWVAQENPCC